MDENLYTIAAIVLVVLGWLFYKNFFNTEFQKELKNDNFGEYFVEDIKKIITHLEKLPEINQKNIYENVIYRYGKFCKEVWKLETPRGAKFKKIFDKYVLEAGADRKINITDQGYGDPKWLAATIFETLLFSNSKKISLSNGIKIRKFVYFKMKKLVPNNKSLKIFMKVEGLK